MPHNYNNGEWCELYVPAKVMLTGELELCDANLNLIGKSIDVLSLIKGEDRIARDKIKGALTIEDLNKGNKNHLLDFSKLKKLLANFEKELIQNKKSVSSTSAFPLGAGEDLIDALQFHQTKAGGNYKQDVTFETVDPASKTKSEVGFSIKSQFANPGTLLNFGKNTTRFTYNISGFLGDKNSINSIDTRTKLKDRIEAIKLRGGRLEFEACPYQVFEENLIKIDTLLPQIIAKVLIEFFSTRGSGAIKDILANAMPSIENVYKNKIGRSVDRQTIEFKIKQFLLDIALGMMPSKPWNGIPQADGGYIIVRENLSLVCLHIYNLGHLKDYLFNNVKFETPSSSKNKGDYCYIYNEQDKLKIDLQLQIRFT